MKITEKELHEICFEILKIFKKHKLNDGETLGLLYLIISEVEGAMLTREPQKKENMALMIEDMHKTLIKHVLGER